MEVEITHIGAPDMHASARVVEGASEGGRSPAGPTFKGPAKTMDARLLSPLPSTPPYDGTVQLAPLTTSSFTWGTRGGGGYRYVSATFRVRNATQGGEPYIGSRQNLTFLAVSTASTLNGTAIHLLKRFDDTPAASGLAAGILPTGAARVALASPGIASEIPDVLQAFTEVEVAAVTVPVGVTSIMSYGFVVRNPATGANRILAANPGVTQFDGQVTFAFRVPLQATAAQDPFTITAMFLPVDDNQLWITQSVEETDAASQTAIAARAGSLGAQIRALGEASPAFSPRLVGGTAAVTICPPRVAGTASAPAAFLFSAASVFSLSPDPYPGTAAFLPANSPFSATFCQTVTGAAPATFAVNGSSSGRWFLGQSFTGNGTVTVSSPTAGPLRPNEEVEVVLTGLTLASGGSSTPKVARYRVASAPASGAIVAMSGSPFTIGGPTDPQSIESADFNRDGYPDLVTANRATNDISVLLNDRAGGFTFARIPAGRWPTSVAVGDVNGDVVPDVLVTNRDDNSLSVLLGDGSGGFSNAPGSPISVGSSPSWVAVGDLNHDGHLDAVVISMVASNNVAVLLGAGSGGFSSSTGPFTTSSFPQRAVLGLVDGDANLDVLTTDYTTNVSLLRGDGAGGFGAASSIPAGGNAGWVAIGDLNHDASADLVTANSNSNTISVILATAPGVFAAPATRSSGGTYAERLALGFMNGGADLDVVVANLNGGGNVNVFLGDGAGGLSTATGSPVSTNGNARGLTLADLNGDAHIDVVTTRASASDVVVLLGDGTGSLTPAAGSPFPAGAMVGAVAVAAGDVNGDGRLDIATANQSSANASLFIGTPGGSLLLVTTPIPAGTTPSAIAMADVNGDGHLDLVIANSGSNNVTVKLGDGSGGFAQAAGSPFAVGTGPQGLAIGDVNGDGRLDIVTANYGSSNVSVLLGNGSGGFSPAPGSPFAVGTNPRSLALADLDADGHLDIVTANWNAGTVSILLGTGAGGFVSGGSLSAGTNTTDVAVGDVNGDGRLDIAVSNASNQAFIYLGNGTGGFSAAPGSPFAPGTSAYHIALGDLNGDGTLDIAIAHFGSNNVSVRLGNGNGTFTSLSGSPFAVGSLPIFAAFMDLNGDNKLDLVATQTNGVTVLVNP